MRDSDIPGRLSLHDAVRPARAIEDPRPIRALVVDRDRGVLLGAERALAAAGFEVTTATSPARAGGMFAPGTVDVVLLGAALPETRALLERVAAARGNVQLVLLATEGDSEAAAAAVRAGAFDVVTKPFDSPDALVLAADRAGRHARLLAQARRLEREIEVRERYGDIVGSSAPMRRVYQMVESVAHSVSPVLLEGEPGTGKELVARAIHARGARADGPFVPVSCSAIPEALVESELFGSLHGPAADAPGGQTGLLEAARGGTLFLGEVGRLPLQVQVRLERTLKDGEITRVGASEPIRIDVRVVAASDLNLAQAMREGRFREDLYYRLAVISLRLPALRERPEDVPLLAYHFLHKYSLRAGREIGRISLQAMRALRSHPWPGNVRELENAIERAVVMARGDAILPGDLPPTVVDTTESAAGQTLLFDVPFNEAKRRAISHFESTYVQNMLKRTGGNVSEAARQAGMDRSNFRRILKKHKIR